MKYATILGLVALAIASLTAFVASSASAAQFKSSSSPVMLFGEDSGNHQITVDGQSLTCTSGVFEEASLATPANTVTELTAAYNGCSVFGMPGSSINMGNCTFELQQPSATANGAFEGNLAFRCNAGGHITTITSFSGTICEVWISEANNTNLSKIIYQNSPNAFSLSFELTGIQVDRKKDGFFCPLKGTGIVNTATYYGPLPVNGTSGNVFVG